MENKPIILAPYDPLWPAIYQKEAKNLTEILQDHALKIEHIGSTSIQGLVAKPKIDILCVIDKLENSLILKDHGYSFRGELNLPLHYYFSKKHPNAFNLHVVEKGHGFINLNLVFRDFLKAHPTICEEYAALKTNLLSDSQHHTKTASGFSSYNLSKNDFIKKVLKKADYQGSHASFCMHEQEWKHYYKLLKMTPLNEPAHHDLFEPYKLAPSYHFVWYQGGEIIGAAHLEVKNFKEAFLSAYKLNMNEKDPSNEDEFKAFLKKWAQSKELEFVE